MMINSRTRLVVIIVMFGTNLYAQRRINNDTFFNGLLPQFNVTVASRQSLEVLDTALFQDIQFLSSEVKSKVQIFRTMRDRSDTNYIIGMNFYPNVLKDTIKSFNYEKYIKDKVFVSQITCFRFEVFQRVYNCAERCKEIMVVDSHLLTKVNADIGFIYSIKTDIRFRDRFKYCMVFSYQKYDRALVNLYYCYNDFLSDDQILEKIYGQCGLVRINN